MNSAKPSISLSSSFRHVLILCLSVTGVLSRHHFSQDLEREDKSSRQGGFPKFPLDDFSPTVSCGLKISPKIVGGTESTYGEHPWQVEMEIYKYGNRYEHQCGGAIIGPQHILTAAHCLYGHDKSDFRIKVGEHNLDNPDEGEKIFAIGNWTIHPNFRIGGQYTNDMAVVKLQDKGIQMSRYVSPVCLPTATTPYTPGTKCKVSGWGLTDPFDQFSHSRVLLTAEVPLVSKTQCQEFHGKEFKEGMVCAGYGAGKIDACHGDSGGPLTCELNGKHTLLGLVSWGAECAEPNLPGVYTNTQYYLNWIQTAVEEL